MHRVVTARLGGFLGWFDVSWSVPSQFLLHYGERSPVLAHVAHCQHLWNCGGSGTLGLEVGWSANVMVCSETFRLYFRPEYVNIRYVRFNTRWEESWEAWLGSEDNQENILGQACEIVREDWSSSSLVSATYPYVHSSWYHGHSLRFAPIDAKLLLALCIYTHST
jgi:hypothetical protein